MYHYAECHYGDCLIPSVIGSQRDTKLGHFPFLIFISGALNAFALSVIMLRVILQSFNYTCFMMNVAIFSTIIPSAIRMIVLTPSVIMNQIDTRLGHFSLQNGFNSGALNAIVLSVIMLRVILQSLIMLVLSSTIIPSAIRMIVLIPNVIVSQTDTKLDCYSFLHQLCCRSYYVDYPN